MFKCIECWVDILKIFPASNLGAGGIKALHALLPETVELYAVGGVGNEDFQYCLDAGITSFGLGSALYRPSITVEELYINAEAVIKSYKASVIN